MQIQYLSLLLSGKPYNSWNKTNVHLIFNHESLACLLVLEHMTIHNCRERKKKCVRIQSSVQIQYVFEFETLTHGYTDCIRNTIFVRIKLVPVQYTIQYLCLALSVPPHNYLSMIFKVIIIHTVLKIQFW